MMFVIHWQAEPKRRDSVMKRFQKIGHGAPKGITIVASYHSVTQLEGWAIAETKDSVLIGRWLHAWTDLNVNHVTPVVDRKDMLKIVAR